MKKKSSLIIILIVLIVVIIGASFAYKQLSKNNSAQNLVSNGETVNNTAMNDQNQTGDTNPDHTNSSEADEDNSTADSETVSIDFTVLDWDGNPVQLSDFAGKPVILNFWASWCGPCQSEMPDFDEMYALYGEDIHFVMVNVTDGDQETVDSAKAFIESKGYSFPVYFDTNLEASLKFQTYSLPTTYFLDANGQPIAQATGAIKKDVLKQGIDMIYSE